MKEPSAPESRRAEYEHRATFEALGIDKAVGERARTLFERDGRPDGKTEADYRAQAETDLRNRQPLIEARALDIQRLQGKPKDVAERQAAGEVASLYDRIAEYADDIKWARARTAERAGDTGAQALDVTSLTVAEQMIRQAQPAIAERAQRLWSEAGMPEGDGLRYWQRAEKEIIYGIEFVDDPVHRQTADLVRAHWERAGKPAGGEQQFRDEAERAIRGERSRKFYEEYQDTYGVPASFLEAQAHLDSEDKSQRDAQPAYFLIGGRWRHIAPPEGMIGAKRAGEPYACPRSTPR